MRTHFGVGKNRYNPIKSERYMFNHFYGTRALGNDAWYPRRYLLNFSLKELRLLAFPFFTWWYIFMGAPVLIRDPLKFLNPFAINEARIDGRVPFNYRTWEEGKHRYEGNAEKSKPDRYICDRDWRPEEE